MNYGNSSFLLVSQYKIKIAGPRPLGNINSFVTVAMAVNLKRHVPLIKFLGPRHLLKSKKRAEN